MGDTAPGMNKVKAEIEASFGHFVNVILEVLLPVALFFVGLGLLAPAIGLSGFYAGLLSNAPIPQTAANAASSGVAILTYLAVGGGFVMVERTYDGWFGDIVGAIGWMSIGAAIREVLAWLTGNSPLPANGFLSTAASKLQSGITSAASGN
jgi:hypothetical protein